MRPRARTHKVSVFTLLILSIYHNSKIFNFCFDNLLSGIITFCSLKRCMMCFLIMRHKLLCMIIMFFQTLRFRFTFLHAPKEMRSKNVEALRTLLALCDTEPDSLQDTWNAVLECVSRLEFITSTPAISATVMLGSNQISKDAVVQSLKELAGKPAEQVFVNSVKLPSDSIVEFFNALCGVSAEELRQTPARVFSLQKLVEISYYNMARIRMVFPSFTETAAFFLGELYQ